MTKIDLNETIIEAPTSAFFTSEVYDQLPPPIKKMVNVLIEPNEKAVFLMGTLGILSGMLPNIHGVYDGQTVYPNLYIFLIGPYGSGKGALSYARELGQAVHRHRLADTRESRKNIDKSDPVPPQLLHFIPANNSKTGFFELLDANLGAGTLFESEGDTLADAIKQDYGKFSDGLRKGYHHEAISYYRRTGKEFVEIDNPRLSVVLSATFDQMLGLIPTSENGLFSRFCFYNLQGDPKFKNVFAEGKTDYQAKFKTFGLDMGAIYEFLREQPDPVTFSFTDDQQKQFVTKFQALKDEIRNDITTDLDGLVNRLGLQYFRICMILSVYRALADDGINNPLYCKDVDFDLTGLVIDVLTQHAIDIYLQLPQPQDFSNRHVVKSENVQKALELRQAGYSYSAIAKHVLGSEKLKSTIYRWLQE